MDYTQKVLLNSSINKKSTNEDASLNLNFSSNKKILPEDTIKDTIDAYNVYIDEREKGNKIRLVVNINPFCSNVLFNPFTEIVKNEGSPDVECLNYKENGMKVTGTIVKTGISWTQREAIRDTQLSNDICGFDYHCGIDIFNNHTLRQTTLGSVNYNSINSEETIGLLQDIYGISYSGVPINEAYKKSPGEAHKHRYVDGPRVNGSGIPTQNGQLTNYNFNTIDDYMRDKDGVIISSDIPRIEDEQGEETLEKILQRNHTYILPLHIYQRYNTKTFEESFNDNLVENNGWYGFYNEMVLSNVVLKNGNNDEMSEAVINKTINNKEYGEFIDMYPGRNLYSFTPIYNRHRNRLEKNWNYCLTYPSKSVIRSGEGTNNEMDFPFFHIDDSGNTSLKVYMFDEGTVDDDGIDVLTIYTICQHGLMEGDTINIYKNNNLFYDSVEVKHVIDKYVFQVKKDTANMSQQWIEVESRENGILEDGKYPICESNRCNIDPDAQDIHFRRVVDSVECKYYVRVFSRLPNFKFKDEEVNDYTLYDYDYNKEKERKHETLLERFSNPQDSKSEFESHSAKLGFSNTSYGDDTTEIVFTDDIDLSYLKDNLGRPLSDIYLTIVKNNAGYKEWYGINSSLALDSANIEYSHCFGKVNGSFLFSKYYREYYNSSNEAKSFGDVRDITSSSNKCGLITEGYGDFDEINFKRDYQYYGDICCYSPVDCDEQTIQIAMHRFNTVQRELGRYGNSALSYANFNKGVMEVDEIKDDEYSMYYNVSDNGDPYERFVSGATNKAAHDVMDDSLLYHTINKTYDSMTKFEEGYYYQPHYRISVKTVSEKLNYNNPIKFDLFKMVDSGEQTANENIEVFTLITVEPNYFLKNDKLVLYKRSENKYFHITVLKPISFNKFTCTIADENGKFINVNDLIGDNEYTDHNDYLLEHINDYVLVKKQDTVPDYAEMIKDGSCRYCWRDVVSNGIENDANIYPFTNGAFYINRRINFFLRRQDPMKEYLGRHSGFDYVDEGEDIRRYPNFIPYYDDDNYDLNEIEPC